jgi:hypothetical protein
MLCHVGYWEAVENCVTQSIKCRPKLIDPKNCLKISAQYLNIPAYQRVNKFPFRGAFAQTLPSRGSGLCPYNTNAEGGAI